MDVHSPGVGLGPGSDDERSLDAVFEALSHHRRRRALACLDEHSQPTALADLARTIAERERDGFDTQQPNGELEEIRTALNHVHVPKLVEAGLIEHDRDRNTVRATAPTDPVELVRSHTPASD